METEPSQRARPRQHEPVAELVQVKRERKDDTGKTEADSENSGDYQIFSEDVDSSEYRSDTSGDSQDGQIASIQA